MRRWLKANLFYTLLYCVGLLFWLQYFNFGQMHFTAFDWPKEILYLNLYQQAFWEDIFPYFFWGSEYLTRFAPHVAHGFFLGIPETLLSPQILLLKFFQVRYFILMQIGLLYSLGVWGCMKIRNALDLDKLSFFFFFSLFNFNGHIVSHIAVGHASWMGYFLFPFVCLYIWQWTETGHTYLPAIKLAFVFFVMFLQGAFHLVNISLIFLFFMIIANPRWWRPGLLLVGLVAGMASFRLIPSFLAYYHYKLYPFIGGYESLGQFFEAFVNSRGIQIEKKSLEWWEYNAYLGVPGFVLILVFGLISSLSKMRWTPRIHLGIAAVLTSVFAFGKIYWNIFKLPIPFFNSERVTSRFIILPLLILLFAASVNLNAFLRKNNFHWKLLTFFGSLLGVNAFYLWRHSNLWAAFQVEANAVPTEDVLALFQGSLVRRYNPTFVAVFWGSVQLSVLALVIGFYLYRRFRRHATASAPAVLATNEVSELQKERVEGVGYNLHS